MDFRHSNVLAKGTYRDDGLANGVRLRIHKDPYKEIAGSLRAQKDWDASVSTVRNYQGGLGYPYSFIRVTIPECIPERLEIISYANEYAFLYDGMSSHVIVSFQLLTDRRRNGESGLEERKWRLRTMVMHPS